MTSIADAVQKALTEQSSSQKPLAVILAGHNGAGKSTMWVDHLSADLQIPLVNADRIMMSILPEVRRDEKLPPWAQTLRDTDEGWMAVAQKGVEAFVAQAMGQGVPFAMETVFSHWRELENGKIESKVDLIRQMQRTGYFVLLFFVGLSNVDLSIARVITRVAKGGHDVGHDRLTSRFPRTRKAIRLASTIADATIFMDNSRELKDAFTVCRIQLREKEIFDIRVASDKCPDAVITEWLDVVWPLNT